MRCLLLLLFFLKESSSSFEARWDGDVSDKVHFKYVGSARMSIDWRNEFIALGKVHVSHSIRALLRLHIDHVLFLFYLSRFFLQAHAPRMPQC